jgi:hypothetical protein
MGVAIIGDSIYGLDSGNDRVEEFTTTPVAAVPATWGKVKASYR